MSVGHRTVLIVNSNDRTGGEPHDFHSHFENFHKRIASISPMYVSFPHLFYNITTKNNTLVFGQGPTFLPKITWTLTPGFYTTETWFDAFKTFADANGFVIRDDIVAIEGDKLTDPSTLKAEIHTTANEIGFYPQDSTMSDFIGLDTNQVLEQSTSFVIRLTKPVQMQGPTTAFVNMSLCNNRSWSSRDDGKQVSQLDIVDLSKYSFGEIVTSRHDNLELTIIDFPLGSDPATSFRIWLTDESDNVLTLPDNCNVIVHFLVHTY